MNSFFNAIFEAPEDPILSLAHHFQNDQHVNKVNLGIGSYRTAEGKPYLLNSVITAEKMITQKEYTREYLPLEGDPTFLEVCEELIFGEGLDKEKIFGMQTVGGTGAIRLAAEFIGSFLSPSIAIPNPTWTNHHLILQKAKLFVHTYPYYDAVEGKVDFEGMLAAIKMYAPGTVLLLQNACHNPTGADLKENDWHMILEICKKNRLLPFFDNAYQGFSENIDSDVAPIRLFLKSGIEMIVANSFAKNFGLYGERVGSLFFILESTKSKKAVSSQIKQNARSIYSTAPIHGMKVVTTILKDHQLKSDWLQELDVMKIRIQAMRENLAEGLVSLGKVKYQFLMEQKGFFSLLGITEEEVARLRSEKSIYLPKNGRINIAGLTPKNLSYVIDALVTL